MIPQNVSPDEARRLDVLRQYAILDTPPEQALDDLTRLAATLCQTPIALISLVDDRRQWFKSKVGTDLQETPRDVSFCTHALTQPGLLVVPDALEDPRFRDNPWVVGSMGVRFYAGAPLITPQGVRLGTLCVIGREPRRLTKEQEEALEMLGRQVMTHLELRRVIEELGRRERLLKTVFDSEPECVKLLGPKGELRMMNRAGLAMIQADSFEQVAGRPVQPLIVPEKRAAFKALLKRVFLGEEVIMEYGVIGLKGGELWMETHAAPLRDAQGKITDLLAITRDITKGHSAEKALREREASLAAARQIVAFASWEIRLPEQGPPGVGTLHWTEEMYRITGVEFGAETITRERFFELVHPEDREPIQQAVATAIRERRPYSIAHRLIRPDGEERTIHETGQILYHETTGKPWKIVGMAHDITEERKARLDLERSEREQRKLAAQLEIERARLEAAQAVGKVGSWELDLDTLQVHWSAETYRIFETTPADYDPTHAGFLEFVHPEDRDYANQTFFTSLQQSAPCEMQHRILLAGSRIKFLENHWQILRDAEGRPTRAIGTCQDITERKLVETEARVTMNLLQAISDATPNAVFVKDQQGRYLLFNKAAAAFVGRSIQDVLGRNDTEVFDPEDGRRLMAIDRAIMESGRSEISEETLTASGTTRIYSATKVPFRDGEGKVVGLIGISRDITDRKQAEIALQESEERFRHISGQLAKILDHSLDVICTFDSEGRFLQVSAACERVWGYRPEELIGTSYTELVLPEDRAMSQGAMREVTAGNPTTTFENRYLRKDGSIACLIWSARWSDADQNMFCVARDITEARKAEEKTRELDERLSETLETLADGFLTFDRSWNFTYINPAVERMVLRPRRELLGKNLWEEYPEIHGTVFEREYTRALQENVPVQFEEYFASLDLRLEVRAYPSEQGLAVYLRNVSEQHQAREELRLSEERFRLLAKATNDAIWDWDMVANRVWWNEGLEVLFGFRREDVEPDLESWVSRIHPDDRTRVREYLRAAVSQGQTTFSDEYRFLRKDGEYAFVLGRGYIIRNAGGQPIRMIGGMTDLTDRLRAEQQIAEQAALIHQAHDAIYVCALDGEIVFWSKGAERLFGWTATEVEGARFSTLLQPDPVRLQEAERELLAHGEWTGEFQKTTRAGDRVNVDCRWKLLREDDGTPKRYLHIDTDITERKRIEQQFLRTQRMESIGTLAGGIAHDLNNILGPIILSLDIMRMRFTDPASADLLEIIGTNAHRGADMVRQVLSFARGVEGRRVEVQITHVIRDVEKIANETFFKHIQIRSKLAQEVWMVLGDPTQLHQVLLNLCLNARDAMPGSGTLTFSAENTTIDAHYAGLELGAKPGPYVLVQVEDSGTGMSPEVIEKIFDPFFTTKEVGKGTGLGLSTSLAIVKSHGGFIRVYSEVGRGTKFRVYLPALTQPSAAELAATEAHLPHGHGELVLVVDDENSVRQITQQTLEAFGYRAIVAHEGTEAIAIYAQRSAEIAVVLTDMMMPMMDGPALIQVLRKINPQVRIIAASGLSANRHVVQVANLGVKHFLPKPYTAETLLKALQAVLREEPGKT